MNLWRSSIMCVAVLGILLTRSATPHFPAASPLHLTVSSHLNHDHRQCFDHEDLQWGVCAAVSALIPTVSPLNSYTAEPFIKNSTHCLYSNRPPPTF